MISRILLVCVAVFVSFALNGQGLLGKLKQKAEQAAENAAEKKAKEKAGLNTGGNDQSGSTNSGSSSSGSGNPTNKGGGGLVTTPPDVKANLTDAETAFKSNSYGDARYAVQQAMLGVEMEIGNKVLKSLPETVSSLPYQKESDQVTSTGWGWAGLTIQREYLKEDKQLRTMIANNSAWMSAVNMYLANGGYSQTTGGEQNWKQTKVKGHRAVIEYNESSGYKLSVPLGQTSLIVWEAVNFASEQEVMTAANAFDIDGLIKTLGEK
ncbi:MAG TPA: hypothetical protein VGK59_05440 [Ohtaekwangia sp.]